MCTVDFAKEKMCNLIFTQKAGWEQRWPEHTKLPQGGPKVVVVVGLRLRISQSRDKFCTAILITGHTIETDQSRTILTQELTMSLNVQFSMYLSTEPTIFPPIRIQRLWVFPYVFSVNSHRM